MLLTKALDLTDTVTASVTAHLPGPLATPVNLAVSTLTWVPRRVVGGVEHLTGHGDSSKAESARPESAAGAASEAPEATKDAVAETAEPREPEVVLTLDRPAEELPPPIDVVGEALRAEASEQQPAALEDEGHVEVIEEVVYSTSSDDR